MIGYAKLTGPQGRMQQQDLVSHTLTTEAAVQRRLDNIGKGASGQAVQNMNLICGFEATAGLMNI